MSDLMVAFHSGHLKSETSTWRPTLERILDLGIPALFTTYNKHEPIEEEKAFDEMGTCFSKRMEKNRWSGVLPYFDSFVGRYDVYHFNEYWYMVKGRQSG